MTRPQQQVQRRSQCESMGKRERRSRKSLLEHFLSGTRRLTGPDGIGDYRQRLCDFPRYIGEGGGSWESTGDLGYLWRAAPHAPPHRPRDSYVGGVGWGWCYNQRLNQDALLSNMQIKKTDVRAAVEDTAAQRFQPPPRKKTASGSRLEAQGKFASEGGR